MRKEALMFANDKGISHLYDKRAAVDEDYCSVPSKGSDKNTACGFCSLKYFSVEAV
jgi:hypothetical protein